MQVRIKPEAIPEYWLQRQQELADAAAGSTSRSARAASRRWSGITREQAERMLGGGAEE